MTTRLKTIISGLILVLVVIALALVWRFSQEDAKALSGYIEANLSYISPSVSGKLVTLAVHKGEYVKKGQVLFTLETTPYQLKFEADQQLALADKYNYEDLLTGKQQPYIDQAEAEIAKAKADLNYAQLSYQRAASLLKTGDISQQEYDLDLSQYDQAQAQLARLNAQLETYKISARDKLIQSADARFHSSEKNQQLSQWNLSETQVSSPEAAMVFDTYYWVGEQVQSFRPVVSLLVPHQIKLIFYVTETQLHEINIGQKIYFTVDGSAEKITAAIRYISPEAEYTPPVIYSQSTRTDLSYRVEAAVEPGLDNGQKVWHPGQPVSVYLHGVR
ncbi:HlyD family secretion protein [Caedibacter taeniospiralis]|uniref:HlyD family secretion protein n=1 Tax=Caedibacter taeniospiralis TaxID=28907 RepID=UPI0037BE6BE3